MTALFQLLRAFPGSPEAVAAAVHEADPGALVADAARHGLSGIVRHALDEARVSLPPEHQQLLQRQAMGMAAAALKAKGLLLRALGALKAEGLVPVLLKGYGLALRLYPDPLLRFSSDVDLWIESEHVERAERALTALGLKRGKPYEAEGSEQLHHIELSGAAGTVELHFRPISSFGRAFEGERFLERAARDTLEGHPVRYLCPEDELAYLAVHATHHLLQRASWLLDLKLLPLKHPELRWDGVLAAAREMRMEALAYYALSAAAERTGARVPSHVLEALAPARWRVRVARGLFSEERLAAAALARRKPAWWMAKMLLASDLPALAKLAWARAVRPSRSGAARGT